MVLEDSRLGIAHAHDDALRKIAELFAEQVDAADVRRVRVHADACLLYTSASTAA